MSRDNYYSGGKFLLAIEGKVAGFLSFVKGGEPFGAVVSEAIDAQRVVRKHIGVIQFAPIHMHFGAGMSESLYQWISEFLGRQGSTKSGFIVLLDYNFNERSRLEFDKALITEVVFPAFDAVSKGDWHFTLTLQPEATRIINTWVGSNFPGFNTKVQKQLLTSNFRLKISGLEMDCRRVNMIDAIIVKLQTEQIEQDLTLQVLEIPNITFTLAEQFAGKFYDWLEDFVIKGHNAQPDERTGTLELLDSSLKIVLFTLKLSNLGIFRIRKERSVKGAAVIDRVGIELYCEEMAFSYSDESIGSLVDTTRTSTNVSTTNSPKINNSSEIIDFEQIAKRLLATVQPKVDSLSFSMHYDGKLIGERWAAERAALDELDKVAVLESTEWSAIRLERGHSLIVHLNEVGVLPPDEDGPIDLERDNFVEGIVAGASRVLCNAAPHLNSAKHKKL